MPEDKCYEITMTDTAKATVMIYAESQEEAEEMARDDGFEKSDVDEVTDFEIEEVKETTY